MATQQSTVDLIFRGINQVTPSIIEIESGLKKIEYGVVALNTSIAAPIAGITKSFIKIEAAVLAVGAALVTVAVKNAGEFDQSFRFITTLFETTGGAADRFKADILSYAQSSTQSIDSITRALSTAIGSGISYADSLNLLATAEQLAVAQGGDLDATTGLLVSTLNSYGLSVSDAKTISDQFSVTIRDGKISIGELAAGFSQITPIAANVGIGVDQLGAALAVLTTRGVPAASAITGIKNILEGIVNPTSSASKAAAELGVQFSATALKTTGLSGVLAQVGTATQGSAEKLSSLFTTTEGLQAVLLLTSNNGTALENALQSMGSSAGATETAFGKMKDGIDLNMQQLTNSILVASITIGTPLLDAFGSVSTSLAAIFAAIGTSLQSGALSPITTALTNLGTTVATIFADIAGNIEEALALVDTSGFTGAINQISTALQSLFNSLNLNTPQGLANAITNIGNAFNQLTTFSINVFNSLGPVFSVLKELGSQLLTLDPEMVKMGAAIGGWSTAFNVVAPVLDTTLLAIIALGGKGPAAIAAMTTELRLLSGLLASGSIVAALGASGIAGAVGLLAFEATRLTGLNQLFNDILVPNWLAGYQGATLGTAVADAAEAMGLLGPSAQSAVQESSVLPAYFEEETAAAKKTREELNKKMDAEEQAAKQAYDTSIEIKKLTDAFRAQGYEYDAITGKLVALKEASSGNFSPALPDNVTVTQYRTNLEGVVAVNGALVTSYSQVGSATVKATGAFAAISSGSQQTAKDLDEATKKTESFKIKMEELASNERIKAMEFGIKFKIAEIEADGKRVEAAFKSIDTAIQSTGSVLSTLFSEFAKVTDRYKELKLESWIDMEQKRRDEVLQLQKKMTEAEIARIKAQTEALNRGDSAIKIDGSGLKPELEAFMWKILSLIRVRANAEFADYLLGLGVTT